MKNLKRFLTLLLALCLALALASFSFAAGPERSGTVGNSDVTWSLSSTGCLTIAGSGDAERFSSPADQPWADFRADVKEVWFYDMADLAISDLAYWFTDCVNLTSAEVPYTTPLVGTDAFANCPSLKCILFYYQDEHEFAITPGAFAADGEVETNVYVPASQQYGAIRVTTYDWAGDGRHIRPADVYGVQPIPDCAIGNCTCSSCSWYYRYESNGASGHTRYAACIGCSAYTFNGTEAHSGNPCSLCGYSSGGSGGGTTTPCYHTSTYTSWSGCTWYEYCRDCGDLVDYGTSHGRTVYDDWEYYTSSQHRRYAYCEDCGEGSYDYGSHTQATRYAQDSASQHTVTTYCPTCGGTLGTSRESHSYTYGSWSSYSSSQHRRTKTCSDCGYSTYDYGSHSDGNGDGRCDTCSYSMSVTVTWNASANGGTVNGGGSVTTSVTSGSTAAAPGYTPVKAGHRFQGWYTSASGGSLYNTVTVTSARTFYAQFTVNQYTITWDLGNGQTQTTSQTYGQALTLPTTPSKTGYTFVGWYTSETGGAQVTASTTYTTAGPTTYYARWEASEYTITWDLGDGQTETTQQTYGEKLVLPTQPLKDGYTFLGWFTSETGGDQVTGATVYTATSPTIYYAHWKLIPVFSVTVPVTLALTVSEQGEVYAASNVEVVNHSTAAVKVTGVTVSAVNGWTLAPYDTDMASEKVDSQLIGFALNSSETVTEGSSEDLALTGDWTAPLNGSLPLTYDAVVSALSEPVDEQVLSILFVLEWA